MASVMALESKLRGQVEGDDVLVLELGEAALDVKNAREFRDAACALMHNKAQVVFDMTGVRFVDSSGLGALISCLRHVRGNRHEAVLDVEARARAVRADAHAPRVQHHRDARRGGPFVRLR
jgi:anti-anti-sigma factor